MHVFVSMWDMIDRIRDGLQHHPSGFPPINFCKFILRMMDFGRETCLQFTHAKTNGVGCNWITIEPSSS